MGQDRSGQDVDRVETWVKSGRVGSRCGSGQDGVGQTMSRVKMGRVKTWVGSRLIESKHESG